MNRLVLALLAISTASWAARPKKQESKEIVHVQILQKVAPETYSNTNDFTITEESGTRYCGNATVPRHAVSIPWLRNLKKPAGKLAGLHDIHDIPKRCHDVLKWDKDHFCLDKLRKKAYVLDMVRRCTEF